MNRLFAFVLFLALLLIVMRTQMDGFANDGAIAGGVIGGILIIVALIAGYFGYKEYKEYKNPSFTKKMNRFISELF